MPRLEARPAPSRAMSFASPLLALALTLACGVALFALLGKDPARGLAVFFIEPFRGAHGLSEIAALCDAGCAALVVSEDLEELFEL